MNSTGLMYTSEPKRRNSSLLILSVFLVTYFIYTDFNVRQVIGYAVLGALLLLNYRQSITFTKTKAAFVTLVFVNLLLFLFPNAKLDGDTASYMIAMVILMMYLMFADYDKSTVSTALTVIEIAGIIFTLVILFFRVFPEVYQSYIYPLLSDVTRKEADTYMAKGYSIPMAGDYNYSNYVFAISFAISVGQLFLGRSVTRSKRCLAWISAASSLAGILLTGRRSEPVSLVIVFCIVAFIYRKRSLTPKKLAGFVLLPVALIILVAAFLALGNIGFLSRYVNTLQQIIENNGAGLSEILGGSNDITSGRTELWGIAMEQFLTAPFLGIGFFRFRDHIPESFIEIHGEVTNVHNDYLQHLCETGIIGTVLWIIPTFYLLWTAIKQARRIRSKRSQLPADVTILNIVSLGTQLFYAILGLADPCFYARKYWIFYTVGIICLQFSLTLEQAANATHVTDTEKEGASV